MDSDGLCIRGIWSDFFRDRSALSFAENRRRLGRRRDWHGPDALYKRGTLHTRHKRVTNASWGVDIIAKVFEICQ